MDNYADWLVGELETIRATGTEIDLLGHDWGAGHVYGALARRPDLVRTWAGDIAGLLHRDYVWHDMAQAWQTPDIGEQVVARMTGVEPRRRRSPCSSGSGSPTTSPTNWPPALDDEMGRCILRLYRTGAQPAVGELGDRLAAMELPPGLIIDAELDAYVPSDSRQRHRRPTRRRGAAASTAAATGGWSTTSTPSPTPSSPSGPPTDDWCYVRGVRHHDRHVHSTGRPRLRAMTRRWISLVPSPISRILASR